MTSTNTVPVPQRLVGLRLHRRSCAGGAPASPRARQLLDLEARNQQREADQQQLRGLLTAAQQQVQDLPQVVNQRLDEVAGVAVELGLSIARELVGAALDQHFVDPTPTVARCLRDCVHGSGGARELRLSREVGLDGREIVGVETDHEVRAAATEAQFVADEGVPRGGVRAETGAGRLHYDPREVLERICEEVRREASA
jgi:flagellar biosynthesis/type III secretory pathway protein FliH